MLAHIRQASFWCPANDQPSGFRGAVCSPEMGQEQEHQGNLGGFPFFAMSKQVVFLKLKIHNQYNVLFCGWDDHEDGFIINQASPKM